MKKVLIHCSTNYGTSNFGDVLFAYLILQRLTEKGFQAAFYDLSPYVSNYLYHVCELPEYHFPVESADGVIYFAGGYFGEPRGYRLDKKIIHYLRFMPVGNKAVRLNKKMAVIGIGAGNHLSFPTRLAVRRICQKSYGITTRDKESTAFLQSIGVTHQIETCSDIAQTIDFQKLRCSDEFYFNDCKKYVFLHTNFKTDIAYFFAEGLKLFFHHHPNVTAIVGADSEADIQVAYEMVASVLGRDRTVSYSYSTPDNLCYVLRRCGLIITYKLHVGILSAALGCSVIAFPKHEKVRRYYRQIGEAGRYVDYGEATVDDVSRLAEKYFEEPIELAPEIKALAQKNWDIVDSFLADI